MCIAGVNEDQFNVNSNWQEYETSASECYKYYIICYGNIIVKTANQPQFKQMKSFLHLTRNVHYSLPLHKLNFSKISALTDLILLDPKYL